MDLAVFKELSIQGSSMKELYADGVQIWGNKRYTNIIDTVGFEDGKRLSSSGATKDATGFVTTGMIDISAYTKPVIIRTKGVNFNYNGFCYLCLYRADGSFVSPNTLTSMITSGMNWNSFIVTSDVEGNIVLTALKGSLNHFRISGYGSGANLIVTINEEIND